MERPFVRSADQRPLGATMLITERDLQVEDMLAVALEAEMPRFDDAGVNGTDRDFVDLFSLDPEKVGDADDGSLIRPSGPTRHGRGGRRYESEPA